MFFRKPQYLVCALFKVIPTFHLWVECQRKELKSSKTIKYKCRTVDKKCIEMLKKIWICNNTCLRELQKLKITVWLVMKLALYNNVLLGNMMNQYYIHYPSLLFGLYIMLPIFFQIWDRMSWERGGHKQYNAYIAPGNPYWRGRISTADLLAKITCCVKNILS